MDVTRVLAQSPDALANTDIAMHALSALRNSRVREIVVLGRRGVVQAAFSPPEIKEIGELATADLVVRPEEIALDPQSESAITEANARKNLEYLRSAAARGEGSRERKIRLRFLASPVEILGEGRVSAIRVERNRLVPSGTGVSAVGTGEFEVIPVGMVLRSVGYFGLRLPDVPYDERSGTIPNREGRVLDASGNVLGRQYVVGWAKRGPSGLIGTNRSDALATVQHMAADQARLSLTRSDTGDIEGLLRARGVRFTTFDDWRRLDRHEVERGVASGKIREKVVSIANMMAEIEASR